MKRELLSWVGGLTFVVTIWWLGSSFLGPHVLPSPPLVANALLSDSEVYYANGVQTVKEAAGGLTLSILIATLLVGLVGLYPLTERLLYPNITMLKASPAVAFVPLFVSLVGTGPACKVLVASMISFFPLVIGGIDGLKQTPEKLRLMGEGYGANRWRCLVRIKSGYMISGFLSGLKTAAPLSVVGAIVGEYVGGGRPTGVGSFIMTNFAQFQTVAVFAGVVTSTIIGLLFFCLCYGVSNAAEHLLHLRE